MKHSKFFSSIRKILSLRPLLNKNTQLKALLSVFLFVISSILEISLVASVIPLINILIDAKSESSITLLPDIIRASIDKGNVQIIFVSLLILSASFRLLALRIQAVVTTAIMTELSAKAFSGFIRSDLQSLTHRSLPSIQNTLTRQLDLLSGGVISPLFNLVSAIILSIFIIAGIFLLKIKGIFIVSLIVALSFVIPFILGRSNIKRINKNFNRLQVESLNEISCAYELFVPLRLQNMIQTEENLFTQTSYSLWNDKSYLLFLAQYPRVTSETSLLLAIGLLILISGANASIVADFSALALAGLKLIPAFQTIYNSFTVISAYKASIDSVVDIAKQKKSYIPTTAVNIASRFTSLRIENLAFSFENSNTKLFCPRFEVNKSEIVGIKGPSGSGKSTIIKALFNLYDLLDCQKNY
jgi:HlyD family secretion protein